MIQIHKCFYMLYNSLAPIIYFLLHYSRKRQKSNGKWKYSTKTDHTEIGQDVVERIEIDLVRNFPRVL